MGQGDVLARGAKSATFGPAKVSQAKWDEIFNSAETVDPVKEATAGETVSESQESKEQISE